MRRLSTTLLFAALAACGQASHDPKNDAANKTVQPKWHGTIREGAALDAGDDLPDPIILTYRVVAPKDALTMNEAMPVSSEKLTPAASFQLSSSLTSDGKRAAQDCLTAAIYYEAAGESESGQRAVAQVVLNRVRHPAFPKSVCAVVFQGSERPSGCQFTFTCDGSLARQPDKARWLIARKYADEALAHRVEKAVGLATHYHTKWVVPYWRSDLTKLAVVGAHIFYRWQGGYGLARAGRATSDEILPVKLATSIPNFVHVPFGIVPLEVAPMLRANGQIAPLADTQSRPLLMDDGVTVGSGPRTGIGSAAALAPGSGLKADERAGKLTADEKQGSLAVD